MKDPLNNTTAVVCFCTLRMPLSKDFWSLNMKLIEELFRKKPLIERLKSNWGDKSLGMDCFAECRVYLPDSPYALYLLAMNPQDEDELLVIEGDEKPELSFFSLLSLSSVFNSAGDYVIYDISYRRRKASELFKILQQRNP